MSGVRSGRVVVGLAVVVAGLLTGCSTAAEQTGAAGAATTFINADDTARCRLLAPQTRKQLQESDNQPCATAMGKARLPRSVGISRVVVAGHSAEVVTADQTLFLARFDDGWKVTAAGCHQTSADAAEPLDCEIGD